MYIMYIYIEYYIHVLYRKLAYDDDLYRNNELTPSTMLL